MTKICFIIDEIKESDFCEGKEKLNFFLLKALCESDNIVDVYCIKCDLSEQLNINEISYFEHENFWQSALSKANEENYDIKFSTQFIPADIIYLTKHTDAFLTKIVKSKTEALFLAILQNKKFRFMMKEIEREKIIANKNKIILTPSAILKNDLINLLKIDGQKIYILPPAIDITKTKLTENQYFTFGAVAKNFITDGIFILIKSGFKLRKSNIKINLLYSNKKEIPLLNFLIRLFRLNDLIKLCDKPFSEFLNSIDVYLAISKEDNYYLEALEAMSKGKIIIASSRTGIKDIIKHDNNGFIFDITKYPVDNLVKIIHYVICNKNNFDNLKQNAIFSASVYNFEKLKTELLRIINKLSENEEQEQCTL